MNMYFYALSRGDYSDYEGIVIYHATQFTKKEFTEMYNTAIEELDQPVHYNEELAEQMVKMFDFKIMNAELEIHVGSYGHRPIDFEYEERFEQRRAEEEERHRKYRGE